MVFGHIRDNNAFISNKKQIGGTNWNYFYDHPYNQKEKSQFGIKANWLQNRVFNWCNNLLDILPSHYPLRMLILAR